MNLNFDLYGIDKSGKNEMLGTQQVMQLAFNGWKGLMCYISIKQMKRLTFF